MKPWKPLALGIATVAIATATFVPLVPTGRGVKPSLAAAVPPREFDSRQSAALFVGVRQFDTRTPEVPYAVDDAVDLAYVFALERRVSLVSPRRVVLALSGRPQKEESRRRLKELQQAGAEVERATKADILALVQRQAATAGRDGILILSFATHGINREGVPHIFGSSSLAHRPESTISAAKIFDIAAASDARRSAIFVDACRERVSSDTRSGSADPSSAAAIVRRMTPVEGQVVFYAAAPGGYAFDDREHRNGVFTKAVIDGLKCHAAQIRGCVVVETLARFVERQVLAWIRANRDPEARVATHTEMDLSTRTMPLSNCGAPSSGPAHASITGSTLTALDREKKRLWQRQVPGLMGSPVVADLDADSHSEVIVAVTNGLETFDSAGRPSWRARDDLPLRSFLVAEKFRNPEREVVALFGDGRSSRVAIYDSAGNRRSTYDHPGPLQSFVVDRPTTRSAWKLVVAAVDRIFLFAPAKLDKPSWSGAIEPSTEKIERLQIVERNSRRHIAVTTTSGHTLVLDFNGTVVRGAAHARFSLTPRRRSMR